MWNWVFGKRTPEQQERKEIAERNKERLELCIEYSKIVERQKKENARAKEIFARLAELSGETNKAAAAVRIAEEFAPRTQQAEIVRRSPRQYQHDGHEYIGATYAEPSPFIMPRGVVEDDCGPSDFDPVAWFRNDSPFKRRPADETFDGKVSA